MHQETVSVVSKGPTFCSSECRNIISPKESHKQTANTFKFPDLAADVAHPTGAARFRKDVPLENGNATLPLNIENARVKSACRDPIAMMV